jgi:hypothetical protein
MHNDDGQLLPYHYHFGTHRNCLIKDCSKCSSPPNTIYRTGLCTRHYLALKQIITKEVI